MMRLSAATAVLVLAASFPASAAVLSARNDGSNSASGAFVDLVNTSGLNLKITHIAYDPSHSGAAEVLVYTRADSFVGHETANTGWTLTSQLSLTGLTASARYTVDVADFTLTAGTTTGVYFAVGQKLGDGTVIRPSSAPFQEITTGIGSSFPQQTFVDAYLTIEAGTRTLPDINDDLRDFAQNTGKLATGAIFNGAFTYEVIPEPGTLLLAGSGLGLMLWRRRVA